MLSSRLGAQVWVKHENHSVIGAFKAAGALAYLQKLKTEMPRLSGVVAASTGNFGQSIAYAGHVTGTPVRIMVPVTHSKTKVAAIRSWGADIIIHGKEFQNSLEFARRHAATNGCTWSSLHPGWCAV